MNRKYFFTFFSLVLVLLLCYLFFLRKPLALKTTSEIRSQQNSDWRIFNHPAVLGGAPLMVAVANTPSRQELGLSGHTRLSDSEGMLFIFDGKGLARPPFWMQAMLFDLDLIWIKNNIVIGVTKNVPAPKNNSDPLPLYFPPGDIDMVLEVDSGWSDLHNIYTGSEFSLKK